METQQEGGEEKLAEIEDGEKGSVVIFFGLDNGLFYEADEDGERSLPGKDKEGKYHIVGKVEVASGKQAKMLMENCDPIWELIADSNGKSSIVEERLYSFFFAFFPKKTKLRFSVFPLLHNY